MLGLMQDWPLLCHKIIDHAAHADELGIAFGKPKITLDKLREYKEKVVGQLTKGLAGMAKQRKVRTVQGVGRFVSANELEITAEDGSIAGLLGASPGASTAAPIMLNLLQRAFKDQHASAAWQEKLHQIVPSYGTALNDSPERVAKEWAYTAEVLTTRGSRLDPAARAQVLERMVRMRDPKGVYAQGGCIDTTREYPRSVSPDHCELVLPSL